MCQAAAGVCLVSVELMNGCYGFLNNSSFHIMTIYLQVLTSQPQIMYNLYLPTI